MAETGEPYAYTGDDPVNDRDPTGLCHTKQCVNYDASLNGRILADHGRLNASYASAYKYLRINGESATDARDEVNSFNWKYSVKFEILPTGYAYLNYTTRDTYGGKRVFGTNQLFTSPEQAAAELYLGPYKNEANFIRTVVATENTPVLYGAVGNSSTILGTPGSGKQFVVGSWDTNTFIYGLNTPTLEWETLVAEGWHPTPNPTQR